MQLQETEDLRRVAIVMRINHLHHHGNAARFHHELVILF